jgi:hypothetical protein
VGLGEVGRGLFGGGVVLDQGAQERRGLGRRRGTGRGRVGDLLDPAAADLGVAGLVEREERAQRSPGVGIDELDAGRSQRA